MAMTSQQMDLLEAREGEIKSLKGHLFVAVQIIEGFVEALGIDPETSKIGLVSESSGEEMGGATIAELLVVLKGAAK